MKALLRNLCCGILCYGIVVLCLRWVLLLWNCRILCPGIFVVESLLWTRVLLNICCVVVVESWLCVCCGILCCEIFVAESLL